MERCAFHSETEAVALQAGASLLRWPPREMELSGAKESESAQRTEGMRAHVVDAGECHMMNNRFRQC